MRRVKIYDDYKAEVAKLEGTPALTSHVDEIIDSDTILIPRDGSIPAIYLKQAIDLKLLDSALRDWRKVKELPDTRSSAAGASSQARIKKDGTVSGFQTVPKTVLARLEKRGVGTGTLGFLDGRKTRLNKAHPGWLDRHERLVRLVHANYRREDPAHYAKQRAEAKKIPHIRHTAFTTIYIAKNFQTKYHYDDGNLRGAMTCLMPLGEFTGGELVLPRWRIAFALKPGDLLLFDPQQLHGNLPFAGERLSAAIYCEG